MAQLRSDGVRARGAARTAADVLTFLIADVRGYTAYTNERGDRAAAELASRFAEIGREAVEARGGSVIELRGDEILAIFDSARQAIRAAVELQFAIEEEQARGADAMLPIGIGLDAGEAIPVEGGYRGEALNLAARLCATALPGEVIASAGVVHLARPIQDIEYEALGPIELKGLGRPTEAVRVAATATSSVRGVPSDSADSGQPSDLPGELDVEPRLISGRDAEIWWLRGSWRLARRGSGRVVFVVGPDGSGKTRLAAEIAGTVVEQGGEVTYIAFGRDDRDLDGLQKSLVAADSPCLVVLDDLELAADDELTGIERIADLANGRPIMILATYNAALAPPRVLAMAARLDPNGDGRRTLEPLGPEDVSAIAALYLGDGKGKGRVPVEALLERSGGRPGLVHDLASDWARDEASRRLGAIASRTATGRRDLQAMETQLATNIVDLQLIRERSRRSGSSDRARPGPNAGTAVCPFKGLASFESADADFYFGRERLVAELVARLVGTTFLAIVGPSGSGKSSVLRAGVLPSLNNGVLPGSTGWSQVLMRPGDHPLISFRRALSSSAETREQPEAQEADANRSEVRLLERAVAALAPGSRLVIAVDQFEEVFSLAPDEEREAFIQLLTTAAQEPDQRVIVVIAIRADFYGRCASHAGLAELVGASHVLVGPMRADEFARAIELPAEAAGLRVEPELTAALVADVLDEPGGLPLLSTALLELWQRRDGRTLRLAGHQQTGGVRGAVARLAEQAFARLDVDEQTIARGILLRLASADEGGIVTRRQAPLTEFDAAENPQVSHVLSVLADNRLLTLSEGTVEVAHEALLREWPRLAAWLEEDVEGRRLRRHLIEAAKEWQTSGRDAGELYRGARLATALDWTTEHTLELNDLERAFLTDSRAATEHESVRTRRTNRRLRALLAGAVAFLVIALAAGTFAYVQRGEAERAAQQADAQRIEAERSATRADAQRLGAQALTEDELDLSLLLARQAVALDDSVETRGTLLAALLRAPGAIHVLHGTGDRTNWIDISPDGKVVVAGDHLGAVVFFDAVSFEELGEMRIEAAFAHAFSPDGGTLALRGDSEDGPKLMLVDVASRTIRAEHTLAAQRSGFDLLAYTRDGTVLGLVEGTLDENGEQTGGPVLGLFDPRTGAPSTTEIALVNGEPCSLAAHGTHGFMFSACSTEDQPRGVTQLIDTSTSAVTREFELGGSVAVATDDSQLAVASFNSAAGATGSVIFVDASTGEEHPAGGGHDANIQGIGYSPDGKTLVTVGDDRDVLVWDAASFAVRERLHGHGGRIFGPAFAPDGRTLFTASLDGTIIAWDLAGDRRLGRTVAVGPDVNGDGVHTVALSADAASLAVGLIDGVVRLIDLTGRAAPRDIPIWDDVAYAAWRAKDPEGAALSSGTKYIAGLAFSHDGTTLAVGSDLPAVSLVDVATGAVTHFESGHDYGWTNSVTWTPGGDAIVTAGDDGTVRVWDARSQVQTHVVHVYQQEGPREGRPWLTFAALSSDGVTLAASRSDGTVALLDVAADRELHKFQADLFGTSTVRFSPDGRLLATTGLQSGDVVLWDVATGERVGEPLDAHAGFSLDALFSPSGDLLVSGGTDGIARLWDVATGHPYGTPLRSTAQGNHGWVGTALSGDGLTLVEVYLGTDTALAWSLDPAVWAERACLIAGRNLTNAEWAEFVPGRPYAPACTTQTPLPRTVRLGITVEVPATTDGTGKSVHIAGLLDRLDGAFSKFDAGATAMTRVDATHWRIELTGAEGTRIDYRYTLGSRETEERDATCVDGPDRTLTLDYGMDGTHEIVDEVPNWQGIGRCQE